MLLVIKLVYLKLLRAETKYSYTLVHYRITIEVWTQNQNLWAENKSIDQTRL